MGYPQALQSKIKVPYNIIDRDIADSNGFEVESADCTAYTMVRRRPPGLTFVGQPEFLASLPPSRIAEAEAAIQILS